jgi:hypothetical protein
VSWDLTLNELQMWPEHIRWGGKMSQFYEIPLCTAIWQTQNCLHPGKRKTTPETLRAVFSSSFIPPLLLLFLCLLGYYNFQDCHNSRLDRKDSGLFHFGIQNQFQEGTNTRRATEAVKLQVITLHTLFLTKNYTLLYQNTWCKLTLFFKSYLAP